MKGIILAGGSATRLHPMTRAVSKQLLPIYDKPMIFYPLSTLMLAGIRQLLVITTPNDQDVFRELLGDGSSIGVEITYAIQPRPEGLAQALLIAKDFIASEPVVLILGDNLFYGQGLVDVLANAIQCADKATIFTYRVGQPERYGVVTFDSQGSPLTIEEKPTHPSSTWVVTGLYVYDRHVVDIASKLSPSARGELEITDINRTYLAAGTLRVERLGRGIAWLDTGTPTSLLEAAELVRSVEQRQGLKIACIEEIAYRKGFIGAAQLERLTQQYGQSDYGLYLRRVLKDENGADL
jgi:glucose-1-phosphate thymidylyltransferase